MIDKKDVKEMNPYDFVKCLKKVKNDRSGFQFFALAFMKGMEFLQSYKERIDLLIKAIKEDRIKELNVEDLKLAQVVFQKYIIETKKVSTKYFQHVDDFAKAMEVLSQIALEYNRLVAIMEDKDD